MLWKQRVFFVVAMCLSVKLHKSHWTACLAGRWQYDKGVNELVSVDLGSVINSFVLWVLSKVQASYFGGIFPLGPNPGRSPKYFHGS